MTTYGDLVTLLMCFFVLLFAFSEIDAQKFDAIMESFQGSAGILSGGKTLNQDQLVFDAMPEQSITKTVEEIETLQVLEEIINEYIEAEDLQFEIQVELEDRGLVIRFPDNVLFDSGRAVIKEETVDTLAFLGEVLKDPQFVSMDIRVEGHTDNIPINTPQFPSNWELSTTRATNVLKFFIDRSNIDPYRLSASGYGEYHPIASNDTIAGRQNNRRVDVVVMRKFNTTETEEASE
jgi:chemotaxis protein MotB